jgi:hypothetical protein
LNGINFASQREANRYRELLLLQHAGAIWDLRLQPAFDLRVKGTVVGRYVADFMYRTDHGFVIEDVKGVKTPVYRLKKKLLKVLYDIDILET